MWLVHSKKTVPKPVHWLCIVEQQLSSDSISHLLYISGMHNILVLNIVTFG